VASFPRPSSPDFFCGPLFSRRHSVADAFLLAGRKCPFFQPSSDTAVSPPMPFETILLRFRCPTLCFYLSPSFAGAFFQSKIFRPLDRKDLLLIEGFSDASKLALFYASPSKGPSPLRQRPAFSPEDGLYNAVSVLALFSLSGVSPP